MINAKTVIFEETDLIESAKKKKFVEIEIYDIKDNITDNPFVSPPRIFDTSEIILYMNSNGRTKILKNRWGKTYSQDRMQITFKIASKVNKFLKFLGFKPKETDYCIMFDSNDFHSIMTGNENHFDITYKGIF